MKNLFVSLLFAAVSANATSIGLIPVDDGMGTIGDPAHFAVIDGSFDIGMNGFADITLRFNYRLPGHGGPSSDLGQYSEYGVRLNVGDLLFQVGDTKYGIPVMSHSGAPNGGDVNLFGSALKGHVYSTTDYLTTDQVLNEEDLMYRHDTPVWIGATATDLGSLTETVKHAPGSSTYTVHLMGRMPGSFIENMETHRELNVQFGSATCDNGYLVGKWECPVPEPFSMTLVGAGLAILAVASRRRS